MEASPGRDFRAGTRWTEGPGTVVAVGTEVPATSGVRPGTPGRRRRATTGTAAGATGAAVRGATT
ncbi:hypothetical protein, partial [Streptomyces sp. SID11385]|uniref:hypothetical protein n=1 Tax=Streptomyces sp. SID11385 TaxID=2706031 RepID=UPI0019423415